MKSSFVLKGDLCYSADQRTIRTIPDGYFVCADGVSMGAFDHLPEAYKGLPVVDHSGKLIIPGLIDLHMHAPQFAYRSLGMDLELLDWLNIHTFPEESRYQDLDYAKRGYEAVISNILRGPNTRVCLFATVHPEATTMLMDMLEHSGLVSYVGKVNMDRNAPDTLREKSAEQSLLDTRVWLDQTKDRYQNTKPILTPRFIPSCTDELMVGLAKLQREYDVPLQSHLSENQGEIAWVKELCPNSRGYADAYYKFGMMHGQPTLMAHCVWNDDKEIETLKESGTYVVHCPQSNTNLASGIAPVRRYLNCGMKIGLGSDVAGGAHTSIFRAMSDAIQVSKLRWRLVDESESPLSVAEAFYLGTTCGGSFFGKVGSFEEGYEFDAVVLDDDNLKSILDLSVQDRLERAIYLSDDRNVVSKYVRGVKLF